MRYDVNSINTKRALAKSAKELVNRNTPISKITVKLLTDNCSVSRNTFYYHFDCIDDLISWIIHDEFYDTMIHFAPQHGQTLREFILEYLDDNQKFLKATDNYLGYEGFHKSYIEGLVPVIRKYLEYVSSMESVPLSDQQQDFLAHFFADQVGGLYVMYIHNPGATSERFVKNSLEMIFDISIPYMIKNKTNIPAGL